MGTPLGEKSPKPVAAPRKAAARRAGAAAGQYRSGLDPLKAPRLVLQASPHGSGTAHAFKPPLEQSSREGAALGLCGAGSLPGQGLSVGAGEGPSARTMLAFLPLLGLIDEQLGFEPRRELIKLGHPFLTMLCGL